MKESNGLETAAELVESVREDLRRHDERDDERFGSLDGKVDGCRQDIGGVAVQVAWMRGELVSQGASLDRIEKALSRRARTEETMAVDTERHKKKRNLLMLKTVLAVLGSGGAIVVGALLHRWLG